MARLIDADALEKETLKSLDNNPHSDATAKAMHRHEHKHFLVMIDTQPTIDAEPVRHGRWETDEEDIKWGNSLKRKYCTNCGKRPHFDKEKREFVLSDYCPHCGAKMEGE